MLINVLQMGGVIIWIMQLVYFYYVVYYYVVGLLSGLDYDLCLCYGYILYYSIMVIYYIMGI